MKMKIKGWPPGFVLYFVVNLCLLAALLEAGPVSRSPTSVVTVLPAVVASTALYPVPTLSAKPADQQDRFMVTPREATVTIRDNNNDEVQPHDWALVCGKDTDRKLTMTCQKAPLSYYCSGKGSVVVKGRDDDVCSSACRCVNLYPSMSNCVLSYILANCYLARDGTVYDSQKQVVGHLNQAFIAPNGSIILTGSSTDSVPQLEAAAGSVDAIDPAPAIIERETDEALHDWALVCYNMERTAACAKAPYKYTCNHKGKLSYHESQMFCEIACECRDLNPPQRCILKLNLVTCTNKDGVVYDDAGRMIGTAADAKLLANGTLDFSSTASSQAINGDSEINDTLSVAVPAPVKRDSAAADHSYALVCGNKSWTQLCQKSKYGYYCNGNGALRNKGKEVSFCEVSCECIDLDPTPRCIINPAFAITCLVKGQAVYGEDGQLIGNVTEAFIHPNGTMDFTPLSITSRDMDRPDKWALLCHHQRHTDTCHGSYGYSCNGHNITFKTQDSVCDNFCTCSNPNDMHQCIDTSGGHTRCHIDDDDKVYKVNGTLMGPLLGNLENAIVQQDSTIDFSALSTQSLSLDSSTSVAGQNDSGDVSSVIKREADADMDHWMLYCISKEHTKTCRSPPISYTCHMGLVEHKNNADDFVCDRICTCIDNYPSQQCIPTKSFVAECPVKDNMVFHPNGTVLGKLTDAYVHANGTLDFSRPAMEQDLSPRFLLDQMHCNGDDGQPSGSLTQYCGQHGYSCAHDPSNLLSYLQHGSEVLDQCSNDCHCLRPFAGAAKVESLSEATADGDATSKLPENERRHPAGINKRSRSILQLMATGAMTDSTLIAPPSGISKNQSSDVYQLNCGNREDGPVFCSSSSLGYFCLANATLVRNSTDENTGVTWCDYYCKCIFRHPVPCVNEWNIPLCQEFWDGTVRDASNYSTVLGAIDDSWVMPNGSLLVDRGTPYVWQNNGTNSTNATAAGVPTSTGGY
ncbi:hypothetical protein HRR83_001055 [Exophiala dermatitidis]|uniref:Uncharacterized protein n=2 Tax=Exophiala dermatitidis TaxID=5970 RepID=H6C7H4_EXODN|nr:uncharacterized protein HMPREF1120_07655 [Exophiala dermatitidis NIH/UT8656]KAJ4522571.1 hypothetical protein HRR75_000965 [Exophiala dermatitidis]EHY59670.1 hypothetical protein HMPREF1120_07655 [Exophiala dermatitidis NIH/UT8656]KAJ4525866.1 hypothetical protein HRR74_001059 [Exophiala dermatitidis]KAJ4527188.1 hypothetical protein HRR73_001985 [Exophiala dermatitidis]KAJ4532911.1 hypothetical protein HRR76_007886 [Exophiala dermatitidis]